MQWRTFVNRNLPLLYLLNAYLLAFALVGGIQDCNEQHISVPSPTVIYEVDQMVHIAWRGRSVAHYYSAHYCCEKPSMYFRATCDHVCPNFTSVQHCSRKMLTNDEVEYRCIFVAKAYIKYSFAVVDHRNGCVLQGHVVNIKPSLSLAKSAGVAYVNVTARKHGSVLVQWPRSMDNVNLSFHMCYFVNCSYFDSHNRYKVIEAEAGQNRSINVSFPKLISTNTSFTCCVKVRACELPYTPFSQGRCAGGFLLLSGGAKCQMVSRLYHQIFGLVVLTYLFGLL